MLLFEFAGELFQFEQREPEFDVSSQLPPKITALLPMLPSAFLFPDPRPKNFSNLSQQRLRGLDLMWGDSFDVFAGQKPQPKSQMRHARIGDV
jgi:hypothetical protein